jgi:8-oxo-dGTP pyrophosphatase MutT (NUDIX family)
LRNSSQAEATEILFIRRADRHGDPWSGQMAFPGGRREEVDASLVATAVREVEEEIGVNLQTHGRLLGRLPDVPARAQGKLVDMLVTPFVFSLEIEPSIRPNAEVAEVIWTPLAPLARGECSGIFPYDYGGQAIDLPCVFVEHRVVWGLTYAMLERLFGALG